MARLLAPFAALAGALALAFGAAQPPAPVAADAAPDRFSAGRAMVDITAIASVPHPTGSAEDAAARAYLARRLQAMGLVVETQAAPLSPRARRVLARWGAAAATQGVNVIGVLPGRDRAAPALLLMAHHDSVAGSPGSADDAAGVAAILETVRALKAGPPLARDVIALFTDAEELKSDGAAAFFSTHPLARRVGVVVNLEARGGGGRALMFETGPANGPMTALFGRAARGPSASSAAVLVYRLLPNFTDFSIPKAAGTPGFNFAFLGRPRLYHTAAATPAAIDRGSVQHIGAQTLDLARALALAPALPPRGPDRVFGDLFGLVLVGYPAWGGWIVLAAAAGLLVVAGRRAAAAGRLSAAGMARGAAEGLGMVLVSAGLLQFVNGLSGAGKGANYYDRLAAIPRLEIQAALVGLGVLTLAAGAARRAEPVWSGWLGLLALALAAAAAAQLVAPGAGPVLAWPLLIAAGAAAGVAAGDIAVARPASLAVLAGASAVAGGQALGLAHFTFLGIGPDMPGAMSLFLLLAALAAWPLLSGVVSRKTGAVAAVALLAAAAGIALWVRFDAPAPTIPAWAQSSR